MASKARNADDLLKDLDDLGIEESSRKTRQATTTTSSTTKTKTSSDGQQGEDDEDVFGDIQKQLAAKASRPETPRLASSSTATTAAAGSNNNNRSPKRVAASGPGGNVAAEFTPASSGPPSNRTSEDRLRAAAVAEKQKLGSSGEDVREKKAESTAAGGGWWGSMFSAATAAVKQAESLAKDLRGNEEAIKWAEQVRGYGAGLQNLSTDLRSRALPTFTSLMSHIAPPISSHERLQIHITHDILNYPSLDPLIYDTFSRVMVQVEGGDLMVIQRGGEARARTSSDSPQQGYRGGMLSSGTRWTDGPWWRDEHAKRDIGAVAGLREGTRLARVSAESFAKEFFDASGGIEAAAERATQTLSDSNPTRTSDIFLAIQAIAYSQDPELFAASSNAGAAAAAKSDKSDEKSSLPSATVVDNGENDGNLDDEAGDTELLAFAIYLHDPLHSLSFSTLSQPIPRKWTSWLDALNASSEDASATDASSTLPESILEIIRAGGVDPREWVAEWMEEVLGLAVGVLAQRYVARRMGVDEGGLTRAKKRAEEVGVGGEAARAI